MLERVKEPSITQAVSFIRHMSADEKTKELARLEEKRLHDEASIIGTARRQGIAEGREEGRVEGRKEGRIEGRKEGRIEGEQLYKQKVAFKLLGNNNSDEYILDILDISADDLKKIKSEYANS